MELESVMTVPRINYAALDNTVEFYENLIDRAVERIGVSLPCRIEKYDRAKHLADLRVMINWELLDGQIIEGCTIYDVTIRRMYAGGFIIDFPIQVGDTGWLIATDRDLDTVKANRIPSLPSSPFRNTYASGFWIPDLWGSEDDLNNANPEEMRIPLKIDSSDEGRLVIQNAKGTQKISVGQDDIKVFATTATVTAESVNINGPTNIKGNTSIDGTLSVTGDIQSKGVVKDSGEHALATHTHSLPSGGSTGAPNGG